MTDPVNLNYSNIALTGVDGKFNELPFGADNRTVVGTKVVFTPWNDTRVVCIDTATQVVSSVEINTTIVGATSNFFSSAIAVGNEVYFTPYNADRVGIYNVDTNELNYSGPIGDTADAKFSSVTRSGKYIIFTPYNAANIYIIDTDNKINHYTKAVENYVAGNFSSATAYNSEGTRRICFTPYNNNYLTVLDITDINNIGLFLDDTGLTESNKFSSANILTETGEAPYIVFTPLNSDAIGYFDTNGNIFYTEDITSKVGTEITEKFYASTVIDSQFVVFVPYNSSHIIVFTISHDGGGTPIPKIFLSIDTGLGSGNRLYNYEINSIGFVNDRLVFTPYNTGQIGILKENATKTGFDFVTVDTGLGDGNALFSTQAIIGNTVVFTPFNANNVGIFDTTTSQYSEITTGLTGNAKFTQSVISNNTVVFAPYNSDNIGLLTYSIICFLKDTYIETDQGSIRIDKLEPFENTINGLAINKITKHVVNKNDTTLVCIEEGALGDNTPNRKTTVTNNHKILYQGALISAKKLLRRVNDTTKVYNVDYNGEVLYNVLLENYETIKANNMICESLAPSNSISKSLTTNIESNFVNFMLKSSNKHK